MGAGATTLRNTNPVPGLLELACDDNQYGESSPGAGDANGGQFVATVATPAPAPPAASVGLANIVNSAGFTFARVTVTGLPGSYTTQFEAGAACGGGSIIGSTTINVPSNGTKTVNVRLAGQVVGLTLRAVATHTGASGAACGTIGATSATYSTVTNHFYEFVAAFDIAWETANSAANATSLLGTAGHLVHDQTTLSENNIVATLPGCVVECGWWIGLDHASVTSFLQQWTWVTGEPFSFTNWSPGEPTPNEIFVEYFRSNERWNNNNDGNGFTEGYLVEYEPPLVVIP